MLSSFGRQLLYKGTQRPAKDGLASAVSVSFCDAAVEAMKRVEETVTVSAEEHGAWENESAESDNV